ncbi:MAG: serine/threonine protein kinase [Myxococcales bacterium]|nr:serine/threonine protein kinase [Myxococcales bacterium]
MATVHLGRLLGPAGFSRTVAIKRLHPQYAKDPEFVTMFLDEARLAARIRHPNVVSTMDVVAESGELFLVMEYVQGESLARLMAASSRGEQRIPAAMVVAIGSQALLGLHAAHEAKNERGDPLDIVHRDVSPQNILVGVDGVAHVVDFGVAKAAARIHTTQDGALKGKIAYMAPEQLRQKAVDRRTDVFSASIVIWEALANRRLFAAGDVAASVTKILNDDVPPPSRFSPGLPAELDRVVLKGLERDPAQRYTTAREMARELQAALTPAGALEIGEWVEAVAGKALGERRDALADVESKSTTIPGVDEAVAAALGERKPIGVEGTGSTELSAALPSVLPVQQKRRFWLGAAAALLLLGGLGVWFARGAREPSAGAPAAVAAPLASHTEPAGARVVELQPSALPEPKVEPAPAAEAADAAVVPPSASASASAKSKPAPLARPTAGGAQKPPAKLGCNPPYTLNSDGSKRFKPECF